MKKLKKILAVMVAVSSALNMPLAYASDPRGEEDCCERLRRYTEPAYQTSQGISKFVSSSNSNHSEIDHARFYYRYRRGMIEDGRFLRLYTKWRTNRSMAEVKCYTLTFNEIRSHLLTILEYYYFNFLSTGSKIHVFLSRSDMRKFFEYDADDNIYKYLQHVRDKYNSLPKRDGDLISSGINDLPKLVACPPVLYECLAFMETCYGVPEKQKLHDVI